MNHDKVLPFEADGIKEMPHNTAASLAVPFPTRS
jgi:hypothetical protein